MSLIDIEKNDVDISELFRYKDKVTLLVPGTTDEVTFYQRIIGDADNNRARVYALRESANLREQLRDEKWEDRPAYLPNTRKFLKDDLVNHILGVVIQELSMETINETTLKPPVEPKGDASLEEQEEYQKAVDEYPKLFNAKVAQNLEKKLKEQRERLNKMKKDDLKERLEDILISRHAQEKFGEAYMEMCTYYGTYIDKNHKTLAFKSFEDFQNSPRQLKETLMSGYRELQVGSTTLKKSQGVTP